MGVQLTKALVALGTADTSVGAAGPPPPPPQGSSAIQAPNADRTIILTVTPPLYDGLSVEYDGGPSIISYTATLGNISVFCAIVALIDFIRTSS